MKIEIDGCNDLEINMLRCVDCGDRFEPIDFNADDYTVVCPNCNSKIYIAFLMKEDQLRAIYGKVNKVY